MLVNLGISICVWHVRVGLGDHDATVSPDGFNRGRKNIYLCAKRNGIEARERGMNKHHIRLEMAFDEDRQE